MENAIDTLESAQCLAVDPEDGMTLTELNLGLVAAFYYIRYTTIGKNILTIISSQLRELLLEFCPLDSAVSVPYIFPLRSSVMQS